MPNMNHRFIQHIIISTALHVTFMAITSCKRNHAVDRKLDVADSLMTSKPDSALRMLNQIKTSDLYNEKSAARYALLKSMALDKNYVDTTTFDVLQPAIDYYLKEGTPDEKLRTYYYQGRIYQNKGKEDSAMQVFMKACDLKQFVTDTLLLAHTYVAKATMYIDQYKTMDFTQNNLVAAKLYEAIGEHCFAIKSYTNALDGYVIMNNKSAARNLLHYCKQLSQKHSDGRNYYLTSLLSYTIRYGTPYEVRECLKNHEGAEISIDDVMNTAQGYSKIGDYEKAIKYLAVSRPLLHSTLDSLKYFAVKIEILEKQKDFEHVSKSYKSYIAILGKYESKLFKQDLLFSEEKHLLELKNIKITQNRDRIVSVTLFCLPVLIILIGIQYYRSHLNAIKRSLTEKENENLKLAQDNLCKEKKNAELERDKRILETANLKLEIERLIEERDNLQSLQSRQLECTRNIRMIIQNRLDILNCLLAKEITHNDNYAEPYTKWVETIHKDKQKFMDSTRLAFVASHPKFMEYLNQHGLSSDEINYLCLYAIGLRGKEVGEYIKNKRHYIISHEIRMKLGLDEHETNLGLYIQRMIKTYET